MLSAIRNIHLFWHMRCCGSCVIRNAQRTRYLTPEFRPSSDSVNGRRQVSEIPARAKEKENELSINVMTKFGLLKEDLDYHLVRASMVIVFLLFWLSDRCSLVGNTTR